MTASPELLKEAREWLDKRPILRNGEKRELAFAEFAALKIHDWAKALKELSDAAHLIAFDDDPKDSHKGRYWEAQKVAEKLLARFGLDQEAKP